MFLLNFPCIQICNIYKDYSLITCDPGSRVYSLHVGLIYFKCVKRELYLAYNYILFFWQHGPPVEEVFSNTLTHKHRNVNIKVDSCSRQCPEINQSINQLTTQVDQQLQLLDSS